jgi:large conductance mechanosensitive channel
VKPFPQLAFLCAFAPLREIILVSFESEPNMSVIQEFKKFALRGNVIDMAVGIIIGAAFGTVVKSLVDDIIMPPIGYVTSGVDFKQLSYPIRNETRELVNGVSTVTKPAITLNYGSFLNNVITFLIVAWAVFLLVKAMNLAETKLRLGQEPAADAPPPPENILLLREIRDELKRK